MASAAAVSPASPAAQDEKKTPWYIWMTLPIWAPFYITYQLVLFPFRAIRVGWADKKKGLMAIIALYIFCALALMALGKMGAPSRQVLGNPIAFLMFPLQGIYWLIVDTWGFFTHWWAQSIVNLHALADHGDGGNIIGSLLRWTLGALVYIFVSLMQTIVWWAYNGACAHLILTFVGAKIMALVLFPNVGAFSFSLGGGGGHGGGSKGGGHH